MNKVQMNLSDYLFMQFKTMTPTLEQVGAMYYPHLSKAKLLEMGIVDDAIIASAQLPVEVLETSLAANNGNEYDISINCVNVENTEMSSILPIRNGGTVYFFSMATSFTKAALGAEGVGKDVDMIIGNGYTKGHAEITLQILRESEIVRTTFEKMYL